MEWPRRSARLDHFLAGGQHCNARPAGDEQFRSSGGRGQGQTPGIQPHARVEQPGAGFEVLSGGTDVARFGDGRNDHHFTVARGVFLNHHRVGAGRHGRAGENPHRLAGTQIARKTVSRRAFADDLARSGAIGGPHGPAVHRRGGERGLIAGRADVFAEKMAQSAGERDVLRGDMGQVAGHPRPRVVDAEQLHGARQSPDAPPLFSSKRTVSITMPRSAALSMS